jgi:malate dehydrogenase
MKRIAVTGAAGQIAYSLLFRIAQGDLFGTKEPVALHLLDVVAQRRVLEGVAMELEDCAFPLLKEVRIDSIPEKCFENVEVAFLVGAKPRSLGMERKDLLVENGKIFVEQGMALNNAASRDVRVLVVGNPCNTNCLIALHHAPDLSPYHFFAMTRLDQNRTVAQLARKANVPVEEVTNVAIWGNHSSTQVPDVLHARIQGRSAQELLDRAWLDDLIPLVQRRGAEVIAARGKSSAASAAQAALDAMRSLWIATPTGAWFSMGVYARGNPYGIDEDLVFSFPCRSDGMGNAQIVAGVSLDALQEKIAFTHKELQEERTAIAHLLKKKTQ